MVSFDRAIEPSQGTGTAAPSLSAAAPQRFLLGPFSAASGPDGCVSEYFEVVPYKQVHDIDYEQEPLEELENHVISDEEVKKVSGKFPIRKMEVSGARCGA